MPKRQNIRQVESERVQGEGSWVRFRRLTLGEANKMRELAAMAASDAIRAGMPDDEVRAARTDANYTGSIKMLADVILAWNWVGNEPELDESGQPKRDADGDVITLPLPQVKDEPTVLDRLTDEEVLFLATAMQGPTAEEEGKSVSRSPRPSIPTAQPRLGSGST